MQYVELSHLHGPTGRVCCPDPQVRCALNAALWEFWHLHSLLLVFLQFVRYSMSRQFPEGLLFNRCSGHTPVAGRGGRSLAGFFGALEGNAGFCMTAGHMG